MNATNITETTADEAMYTFFRGNVIPLANYESAGPFVYFIGAGGWTKIGYSDNPERRIIELLDSNDETFKPETWNGKAALLAYCPGGYELESRLHERFKKFRGNGEWFRDNQELTELAAEVGLQQAEAELKLMNSVLSKHADRLNVEHRPLPTDEKSVLRQFIKNVAASGTRYDRRHKIGAD